MKKLDEIIDSFSEEIVGEKDSSLKKLKVAMEKAKAEIDETKPDTKTAAEAAERKFNDARQHLSNRIRETAKLGVFSEEVIKRRNDRKADRIGQDINQTQSKIDFLTLEISSLDKEIAAVRQTTP